MWPTKLKDWLFQLSFTFLVSNRPVHPWKWFSASRYLSGGTNCTIIGHLEQILALEMAISCSENCLKNENFWFFSTFFHDFVSNGPVHLWKWIRASKYLTGATSSTFFSHLEQFITLKMAIYKWEKVGKLYFFAIDYLSLIACSSYTICPILKWKVPVENWYSGC